MKLILNLFLLLTLAYLSLADPVKTTDPVKYGKGVGNKILYRVDVVRPAIKGFAQDVYVAYPRDGEPSTNEEIVDIWVYDRFPNFSGAVPVIAYGVEKNIEGPIYNATVILRSQRSRGIDSTVEFYGKLK